MDLVRMKSTTEATYSANKKFRDEHTFNGNSTNRKNVIIRNSDLKKSRERKIYMHHLMILVIHSNIFPSHDPIK